MRIGFDREPATNANEKRSKLNPFRKLNSPISEATLRVAGLGSANLQSKPLSEGKPLSEVVNDAQIPNQQARTLMFTSWTH